MAKTEPLAVFILSCMHLVKMWLKITKLKFLIFQRVQMSLKGTYML